MRSREGRGGKVRETRRQGKRKEKLNPSEKDHARTIRAAGRNKSKRMNELSMKERLQPQT